MYFLILKDNPFFRYHLHCNIFVSVNSNFFMTKKQRTANTGLAKVAVQFSADTIVVNQNLVLRINIYGENRHLRQARNR
jgi:hypothetical protein